MESSKSQLGKYLLSHKFSQLIGLIELEHYVDTISINMLGGGAKNIYRVARALDRSILVTPDDSDLQTQTNNRLPCITVIRMDGRP